jgi:epoxyqueuosine reductase QueG
LCDGRYNEAKVLLEQVVEKRKRAPSDAGHREPSRYRLQEPRTVEVAEEFEAETPEIRKRVLGQEHLETVNSMVILASTYSKQGL